METARSRSGSAWLALGLAAGLFGPRPCVAADVYAVPARRAAYRAPEYALESMSKAVKDAEALAHDGEWRKALAVLDAALAGGLQDPRAYELRGEVQLRLGHYSPAAADVQSAVDLLGGKPTWNLLRLKAMAENGVNEYQTLIKEAEAALSRKPNDAQAFFRKAWGLAGTGDRSGARENLRLAARADSALEGSYLAACALPEDSDLMEIFAGAPQGVRSVPPPPVREAAAEAAPARRIPRRLTPTLVLAAGGVGLGLCLTFGRRDAQAKRLAMPSHRA